MEQSNNNKERSKWWWQLPFLVLLVVGTIFIVRRNNPHAVPFQQEEGYVFGTVFHTTYQCDSSLHDAIMSELQAVDASLSMFNPNSTISRINSNESMTTDSLFRIVFIQAQQISAATDGCFDITVAPLVNAWGFGFKNSSLPDSSRVDSIRQHIGWERVSLDGNQLVKQDTAMVLDFSAIAKGFGADQVASLFNRHDIANYMIEIGGEIVVRGHNPKGNAWTIGINKPVEDSTSTNRELETILKLSDCGMATSGNYRNYYIDKNGRKLAHTIDPHSGYPVQHSILSSTVVAPTCAMADAFATSFMVMGLEGAKKVLAAHPELKAYFILSDDNGGYKIWHSESLKENLAK